MPPVAQTAIRGNGPGSLSAIPAGDRKIPEPIVVPTRTAMALHSPKRRGNSVLALEFVLVEETEGEVMTLW